MWVLVDFTVLVLFDSYISLAYDPCVFLWLWERAINETQPQNGSTFRSSSVAEQQNWFWSAYYLMAVCSGEQISALTHVHVVVTKHNMLWLMWDPAHSLMLSGVSCLTGLRTMNSGDGGAQGVSSDAADQSLMRCYWERIWLYNKKRWLSEEEILYFVLHSGYVVVIFITLRRGRS